MTTADRDTTPLSARPSPSTTAGHCPAPWAADIYARARARNLRHPHAVRILARAWIRIIWRCWQDGIAYDPDKHGGHQRLLMTAAA